MLALLMTFYFEYNDQTSLLITQSRQMLKARSRQQGVA